MTSANPRALALQLLRRFEGDSLYSNLIHDTALRRNPLSDADRGLLTALVYGVIERRLTLNYLIDALSDRPAAQLDTDVAVVTMKGETITSCVIDSVQAKVSFDAAGTVTSDLSAPVQTKNQLGDNYGMKAYAGSTYEWNEQAASFAK